MFIPKFEITQAKLNGNISPVFQVSSSSFYFKAEILPTGKVNLLYCASNRDNFDGSQWFFYGNLGAIDSKNVERHRWISSTLECLPTARKVKISDVCKWLNKNQVNLSPDKLITRFPMLSSVRMTKNAIYFNMYSNQCFLSRVKQADKTLVILQQSLEVLNSEDTVLRECYSKVAEWLSKVDSLTVNNRTNKARLVESKHGQKAVSQKDDIKFAVKMLTRFSKEIEVNGTLMGKLTLLNGSSIDPLTVNAIATTLVTQFPTGSKQGPTDYLIISKAKDFNTFATKLVKIIKFTTGSEIAIITPTKVYKWNDKSNLQQQWLIQVLPTLERYNFKWREATLGDVIKGVQDYNNFNDDKLPVVICGDTAKKVMTELYM